MPPLTLDCVVVRGSHHVETEVDGQVLMMSLDQGKYFALEASARRIWELAAEPVRLDHIVATLTDEYDVEPAQCQSEILAFAESLLRNGLIVAVST